MLILLQHCCLCRKGFRHLSLLRGSCYIAFLSFVILNNIDIPKQGELRPGVLI